MDAIKGGGGGGAADFSPEDLFEAFFGGGAMPGRGFRQAGPGTFVFTSGGLFAGARALSEDELKRT